MARVTIPTVGESYHGSRIVAISPYTGPYQDITSCIVTLTANTQSGFIKMAWARNTLKLDDGTYY
jgi:hypothetical protein